MRKDPENPAASTGELRPQPEGEELEKEIRELQEGEKVKKNFEQELQELEKEEQEIEHLAEVEHLDWSPWRQRVFKFLENQRTEYALCVVIIANLVLLVIETDSTDADGKAPLWIEVINRLMLLFFTIELSVRLFTFRLTLFRDVASTVDALIVILDIFSLLLRYLVPDLPTLGMMRIVRLIRLSRTSEIIELVPHLHIIVMSLVGAVTPLFWGAVMLIMLLATWGILAVQLIHPIQEEIAMTGVYDGCDRCSRAFSTVWHSALTFSQQVIAGDSWGQVTVPVVEHSPSTIIFFVCVFISLNMALMNVILASVVDAVAQARAANTAFLVQQREKELKAAYTILEKCCQKLDKDGSGCLTFDELKAGFDTDLDFRMSLERMNIKAEDLGTVWDILDEDGSGDVSYKEFCEQVFRMTTSDMHTMLIFVKHYVFKLQSEIKQVMGGMQQENKQLSLVVNSTHDDQKAVHEMVQEVHKLSLQLAGPAPSLDIGYLPTLPETEAIVPARAPEKPSSAEVAGALLAVPAGVDGPSSVERMRWESIEEEHRQFMNTFLGTMKELTESTRKFEDGVSVLTSLAGSSMRGSTPYLSEMPPQPQLGSWIGASTCCGPGKESKKQESKAQDNIILDSPSMMRGAQSSSHIPSFPEILRGSPPLSSVTAVPGRSSLA